MFLLTKAVDPSYRLEIFPANLKQKILRLLKSEVINHSCRETRQNGQVPLVPSKPKAQLPKNDVSKNFLLFYSTFKSETSAKSHESEQQDLVVQEIESEIKFFFGRRKFI